MFKYIISFLFLTLNLFSAEFSLGIGDIDIHVSVVPENRVKKYDVDNKLVLDTGIYNSNSKSLEERKIATIYVKMKTKPTEDINSEDIGSAVCILEGDFSVPFRLRMLETQDLNGEIPMNNIKDYFKGEGADLILREKNFKISNRNILKEDPNEEKYRFSAYPIECSNIDSDLAKNIVSNLEYQFELWLEVKNIQSGAIVRKDISIEDEIQSSVVGSAEDLVKRHFTKMQTF